jgi:serine/threonine-protein kinase
MICPRCTEQNADEAQECAKCGLRFVAYEDGVTLDGVGPHATPAPSSTSPPGETPSRGQTPPPSSQGASGPRSPVPASGSGGASSARSPSGSGGAWSSGTRLDSGKSWSGQSGGFFLLEAGADFGPRYHIEALLGEGGMGAVYRARDKELDRRVALKLLQPGLMANPDAVQRFKQELLLASRISHKNVLRIHDLGDVDGIKFISMAFVEGQDLFALVRRCGGKLPVDRAVVIARQIAEALEAAHAEGVIHRDLKPQNVLVDDADHVYVSDFGLAKSLDSAASSMTHAGQVLGTPRYMAPEQVEGKTVDHRADLYALGLILFEMTTGGFPFDADSTLQLMYGRTRQKPKNPALLNPEIPGYLARIILKCLEKEPFRRYQTARDFIADLDAQQSGVMVRGATSGARAVQIALPMPQTRRGWMMAGGAALAVLLVAGLAVWRLGLRPGGETPTTGAEVVSGIPPLAEGKYVAVLPLRTLGGEEALAHVADGLSEGLSAKLFQLESVRVASRPGGEVLAQRASLERVARSLGANLVVDGLVQSAGQRLRIIVHLDDVPGKRRVWSQEFSGLPADLLTLEDQIYTALVRALELKPASAELARAAAHPTENIEAYDLYLRGRNALRASHDLTKIEAAKQFFDQAVQRDPAFPLAFAGLADAQMLLYREKKDPLNVQRALAAAQRAAELNDALPEVHLALGNIYRATGRSNEAVAELRRALALAPHSDDVYRRLGAAHRALGKKEEALEAYRKAVEINPYFWLNHNALGGALLGFGENEKAIESFRRVTELDPENPAGHENLGNAFIRLGRWEDCVAPLQKALALQPYFSTYSNLGTAYFFLRRYADAEKMFEKAVELNPNEHLAVGNLGDAQRWLGKSSAAQATYERAIALAYKELEVNPKNAATLGMLALYYAKKGDAKNAQQFMRRARAIDPSDVQLAYSEAVVAELGGRTKDALNALREAFRIGYPVREAENDPEFMVLAKDPGFQKLVKEFTAK